MRELSVPGAAAGQHLEDGIYAPADVTSVLHEVVNGIPETPEPLV